MNQPTQSVTQRQMSVQSWLIATTAVAGALALLRLFGIVGAVLLFLAAALLSIALWSGRTPRAAMWQDLLWGAAMPLVCLFFDPLILRRADDLGQPTGLPSVDLSQLRWFALPIYLAIFWQILIWLSVVTRERFSPTWAALLAGSLSVGAVVACGFAALLFLPALLAVGVGMGLLGLTPILTAAVMARRVVQLYEQSKSLPNAARWGWTTLGVLAGLGIPLAVLPWVHWVH